MTPRWEKGAPVENIKTGERGTLTGDFFWGWSAVRWDGTTPTATSWVDERLLRLLPMYVS
jgi:hypothetical protein